MKIWIFSLCRNEAAMLPFYLRHYASFAERINIWDDHSDDGSREILKAHPKVALHDWEYDTGIDEEAFLQFAYNKYPTAIGHADWVMWPDIDEFIWSPNIRGTLAELDAKGYPISTTEGFNMYHDGLPKDDGKSQIYELAPMGVRAPVYSKPIVFKPMTNLRWSRGKHVVDFNGKLPAHPPFKLLHYRYLGREYTAMKNAKNYARCGLKNGDKGPAWTCDPNYHGEHSADWAATLPQHIFKVV